jgi:hypothetical protein
MNVPVPTTKFNVVLYSVMFLMLTQMSFAVSANAAVTADSADQIEAQYEESIKNVSQSVGDEPRGELPDSLAWMDSLAERLPEPPFQDKVQSWTESLAVDTTKMFLKLSEGMSLFLYNTGIAKLPAFAPVAQITVSAMMIVEVGALFWFSLPKRVREEVVA